MKKNRITCTIRKKYSVIIITYTYLCTVNIQSVHISYMKYEVQ